MAVQIGPGQHGTGNDGSLTVGRHHYRPTVAEIRNCLIAAAPLELSAIETVYSHPQANAQCARFIRSRLPQARVLAGPSTAEAVRMVAEHDGAWAALGNRLAAERYECQVLRAGVEDVADNETRFVWLAGESGETPKIATPALAKSSAWA